MPNDTAPAHRILVVDDEPDITALVAYHLAKEGYRVTTAGTGADALRSAREERPDMVVLDLMLPGHSGFDVLATLRRAGPPHRMTPAELMRSSMITSGAVTQRIDRLEKRGLITRAPSEFDGRQVHVALTERGLQLIEQALPDHVANEHRLLQALTPGQRKTLSENLRKLLDALGDTAD